jgi:hypothetical protein
MQRETYAKGLTLLERIDDRCGAFEAALLAGDDPDPADYVGGFAGTDRDALPYEIVRVWSEHESPSPEQREDWLNRFADQRDVVSRALADANTSATKTTSAPSRSVAPDRRFGRYLVRERLGSGGMGRPAPAPTSTAWGSCSTKCSPAGDRSRVRCGRS